MCIRDRLARTLETDLAGRGPRDHVPNGVGDRNDGVVERALDVSMPMSDVLLLFAAHLLGARSGPTLRRHLAGFSYVGNRKRISGPNSISRGSLVDRDDRVGLLADLLLAGHGALGTLAADVGGHLTTEVTFDLEVAFKEVAELDELLVTKVTDASVGVDARRGQCLLCAGTTHAENIGKCDLDTLFAWEVYTNKTCHLVRSPDHCGGLKHHHSRDPRA